MTQNWLATIALITWPLVGLWLYSTRPVSQATLWTILGGLLLLPVGAAIKIAPGIPQLDKVSIPNLAAMFGCLLVAHKPLRFWEGARVTKLLLAMFLIGPFVTSQLNGDVIFVGGGTVLPSVGNYDALSAVVGQFIYLLPFFLGRQFLHGSADTAELMRTLAVAGILYSVPMLVEIRLSPQLHYWLYGYYPSQFAQAVRDNGFRPIVFMGHGLMVAFFIMTATVASAALWQTRTRISPVAPAGVVAYLSAILLMCKTLGALVYGILLVLLVRFTQPRFQVRIALALAAISLAYPILRIGGLVPTTSMVELASSISEERAASLQFRFDNERKLLEHASERMLFGWGRFGRGRVYDATSGKDASVTDGRWIITLGQFGLLGFLAEFGLLALPIFRAVYTLRFIESREDRVYLTALALIVAISMIDLLPNSTISPWTWLLAGALMGRTETLRAGSRRRISTSYLIGAPVLNAGRSDLSAPHDGNADEQSGNPRGIFR